MIGNVSAAATAYAGGMKTTNTPAANLAALQAALNTGKNVRIPEGVYQLAPGALAKASGQIVFGDGKFRSILDCRGGGTFLSNNGFAGFEVRDLGFNGKIGCEMNQSNVTGGWAIELGGSAASKVAGWQIAEVGVRDVWMDGMFGGIFITDVNTATIFNVAMQQMGYIGVAAEAANANLRTDCIRITHVTYSASSIGQAGFGTGIYIGGCVHTIRINDFAAVGAAYGLYCTSLGLPFGHHASFIFANDYECDFPVNQSVIIDCIDRCRFTNSYFHGSTTGNGLYLGAGVRDAKFIGCNITGNHHHGIVFDGDILDMTGCEVEWNSQAGAGVSHGIVLGNAASQVRIVGGGTGQGAGNEGWGIYRSNPATMVSLAAADQFYGLSGSRNF